MKYNLQDLPKNYPIAAIKLVRYITGIFLNESKTIIDLARANSLPNSSTFSLILEALPQLNAEDIRKYWETFCNSEIKIKVEPVSEKEVKKIKEIKEIKTQGTQTFNVPNDAEGRTFLKSARKYLNRPTFNVRSRGRGNRANGNRSNIALSHAEWIAVYIDKQKTQKVQTPLELAQTQSIANMPEIIARNKILLEEGANKIMELHRAKADLNLSLVNIIRELNDVRRELQVAREGTENLKISIDTLRQVNANQRNVANTLPDIQLILQQGKTVKVKGAKAIEIID